MIALFYDTETTGIPDFKAPSSNPTQPHIVECSARLVDTDTRTVLSGFDLIARPDGWSIDPEVVAIHGITEDHASTVGVDEFLIVAALRQLWLQSHVRVGHSQQFDARIVRIAFKRFEFGDAEADRWKAGPAECTCVMGQQFMPVKKRPKLGELYAHLLGKPLDGAHRAGVDTEATIACYFAMRDQVPA